jgi:putative ABC transport system substrate-binding protein
MDSRRGAIDAVAAGGNTLGVEVIVLTPGTVAEIDAAVGTARQRGIGALLIQTPSTLLYVEQKHVLAAGVAHGMPLASGNVDFATSGGLIEYGGVRAEAPSLTATYVARILLGEKVAELPVQQAVKVQLILNLKTARALGIAFPQAILGAADEVIE